MGTGGLPEGALEEEEEGGLGERVLQGEEQGRQAVWLTNTHLSCLSLTSACLTAVCPESSPDWMLTQSPGAWAWWPSLSTHQHSQGGLQIEGPCPGEKGAKCTLQGPTTPQGCPSIRIQAPGSRQRLSLDKAKVTAGQMLYRDWNLLDAASRINFFPP
uniref:Uncharacterized protein n=1 Tax=Spermophilus dauricus TaxID=99837 RepID=A0A8C9P0L5_SPEDA